MTPDLSGRTILVTGGTGGAGLATARVLRERGAELVIGSRDPARYADAAEVLGSGVHPFIADVTDRPAVERAIERLYAAGVAPTDVIHAAAGGMEPLIRGMMRRLVGLRKLPADRLGEATRGVREELSPIVAETRELARRVNCEGPAAFLDLLVPRLPRGGSVMFYSSLWASHWPHPQVPIYYEAVAEGKQALERFLEERAPAWGAAGVTTAVISANLITGTRMGTLLDRWCTDLMPPADRERWRSTYVDCADLVEATLRVLTHRRSDGEGLLWLWIPLPGQISDRLGREDLPLSYPVALAPNSPSWA
jgi:NAD(P)-dependent dehydrogenase (short-subunit alcohol dehydrogenase family)